MAIEDILPIEILKDLSTNGRGSKKKKKIDNEAMASSMMRIPRMNVEVVRDLLDVGIKETYELQGRSPETLFSEILNLRPNTLLWKLPYIRMAVYFSENEEPEPHKLNPQVWLD